MDGFLCFSGSVFIIKGEREDAGGGGGRKIREKMRKEKHINRLIIIKSNCLLICLTGYNDSIVELQLLNIICYNKIHDCLPVKNIARGILLFRHSFSRGFAPPVRPSDAKWTGFVSKRPIERTSCPAKS